MPKYYDPKIEGSTTWEGDQLAVGPRKPVMEELARLERERDDALAQLLQVDKTARDSHRPVPVKSCLDCNPGSRGCHDPKCGEKR